MKLKPLLGILYYSMFLLSIFACSKKNTDTDLSNISVSWAHNENKIENENYFCFATFGFYNKSKDTLKYNDWALYFNQNTLLMADMNNPDIGVVEHLNGDLYRFVPGKDFILNPGDSLSFQYSYKGVFIKDSDGPKGLYFVKNLGKEDEEAL